MAKATEKVNEEKVRLEENKRQREIRKQERLKRLKELELKKCAERENSFNISEDSLP